MSKEMGSILKVLPPFLDSGLEVTVRDNKRTTRYAEAIALPESIFEQARTIGENLIRISQSLPELLRSSSFRQRIGVSEERFRNEIEPFLMDGEKIGFFGADAIIDKDQKIKLIEINTRPQVLGRFDEVTPRFIGQGDPNGKISPEIKTLLDNNLPQGKSAVIISHPNNAFYNYHKLLGEQLKIPVVPIQELAVDCKNGVEYQGKEIGIMVRQFNIKKLFDPKLTNQAIVEAISSGKTSLMNGPVISVMGDKLFLPIIPEISPELSGYFPKMEIYKTGDEISLENYRGWWLKGECGGDMEITLQIDKKKLQVWQRDTIKAMLMGNYSLARQILEGKENQTAERYRSYLTNLETNKPSLWLLQDNVEPWKVMVDDNGQINSLFSMLRMYFVPNTSPSLPPFVHLEMFLKDTPRVSAAGFIVPVSSPT